MPKGEANPPDPRGSARRAEFESLYEQYSREVWALAYARWMDSDLAMDITQEAFLRLWKQCAICFSPLVNFALGLEWCSRDGNSRQYQPTAWR